MTKEFANKSIEGMKKIYACEPGLFLFFGFFHLHRIWAFIDRESYTSFWMGIMENKGIAYFVIMIILAVLCVLGIITFIKNRKNNYWWRWIYIFGGSYVLFDLFAIATGMKFWNQLLHMMFDTKSPYWNAIWLFFILLGVGVFVLGIQLYRSKKMKEN